MPLDFSLWCDFIQKDFLEKEFVSLVDSGAIQGATSLRLCSRYTSPQRREAQGDL